ncbi:MAG: MinD/ParA family protein [Candidatus Latescibacteria bacterium]|jgi:flagellar biosynthesis protein FlhG|nr:MinD/ParA family protein [Candidatus Latescibacterota bacterium]
MNIDIKAGRRPSIAKVYAITSGKGGVGKTTVAVNLSIMLSRGGLRVLLIDADMGLANVDLMTGVYAPHTIEEVINGEASIFDALAEGPEKLTILSASSALGSIKEIESKGALFRKELVKLENAFDIIFIDTGAGISANVVDFVFLAEEVIVIMTPEPTAFADAYAMVKLLHIEKPIMNVGVIVNIVQNEDEGEKIFTKFNEIVKRFLGKEISYRGTIARDKIVVQSIMRQIPLAMYADKSLAMQSFRKISENLLGIKKTNKKSLFSR